MMIEKNLLQKLLKKSSKVRATVPSVKIYTINTTMQLPRRFGQNSKGAMTKFQPNFMQINPSSSNPGNLQ